MLWVRRFFVQIFSSLFLLSLLLLALSVSITSALGTPKKIETWLSESNLYNHFIDNAIKQSEKSVDKNQNSDGQQGSVSLDNPGIQAAAKTAFNSDLIESSVNTIINSNYDWLDGSTATPTFSVDLSAAKQTFAQEVGKYTLTTLTALPKCSEAQIRQLSPDLDPLQLTCLPPSVVPATEAQKLQQQIATSTDFLSNPVLTAATLNSDGNKSEPYYTKLSKAPKVFQAAKKLPIALGVIALISALLVFFISPVKRKGIRRIGFVFLQGGVLLIAAKFVGDFAVKQVETKALGDSGPLQQSFTGVIDRAESGIMGVALIFGAVYAVIGLGILIFIFATRGRAPKQPKKAQKQDDAPLNEALPVAAPRAPETPLVTDIAPPTRPTASGPPPLRQGGLPKKKKLIQL